jgi:protein-tyrosine phosphatase
VILEAVRAGEPAVIFCKLGKDRTGLISALVLACCAATEEEIVSDYIRSASNPWLGVQFGNFLIRIFVLAFIYEVWDAGS